jgi:uncharacterized protein
MKSILILSIIGVSLFACGGKNAGTVKKKKIDRISPLASKKNISNIDHLELITKEMGEKPKLKATLHLKKFLAGKFGSRALQFLPKIPNMTYECALSLIKRIETVGIYSDIKAKATSFVLITGNNISLTAISKCFPLQTKIHKKGMIENSELPDGSFGMYSVSGKTLLMRAGIGKYSLKSSSFDFLHINKKLFTSKLIFNIEDKEKKILANGWLLADKTITAKATFKIPGADKLVGPNIIAIRKIVKNSKELRKYTDGIKYEKKGETVEMAYDLPLEQADTLIHYVDYMKISLCNNPTYSGYFSCKPIGPEAISREMQNIEPKRSVAIEAFFANEQDLDKAIQMTNFGKISLLVYGDTSSLASNPTLKKAIDILLSGEKSCLTNLGLSVKYAAIATNNASDVLVWGRGAKLKTMALACVKNEKKRFKKIEKNQFVVQMGSSKKLLVIADENNILLMSNHKTKVKLANTVGFTMVKTVANIFRGHFGQDPSSSSSNNEKLEDLTYIDLQIRYGKNPEIKFRADSTNLEFAKTSYSSILLNFARLRRDYPAQYEIVKKSHAHLNGKSLYVQSPIDKYLVKLAIIAMEIGEFFFLKSLKEQMAKEAEVAKLQADCKKDKKKCEKLPIYYLKRETPEDTKKGVDLARKYCKKGMQGVCYTWGFLNHTGKHIKQNKELAKRIFMKSCKKGIIASCQRLGRYWGLRGKTKVEVRTGEKALKIGCRKKNAYSCIMLAYLHMEHKKLGYRIKNAERWFKRACDLKSNHGCHDLAYFWSYISESNKLKPKHKKAHKMFLSVCAKGFLRGCNHAGDMYEKGTGIPKDLDKALVYYKKSCDGGEAIGCSGMADVYQTRNEIKKSIDMDIKACNRGYYRSCYTVGKHFQEGTTLKKDIQRATYLFDLACKNKIKKACTELDKE